MIQEQTISFDKLVAALKEMNDKKGRFLTICLPLNMARSLKIII